MGAGAWEGKGIGGRDHSVLSGKVTVQEQLK